MNLQWYIRPNEGDAEKGPFERATLVDAVLQRGLRSDTQVRREDQAEWSTLWEHPAFRAGLAGWRPGDPKDDEIPGVDALSRLAVGQKVLMVALVFNYIGQRFLFAVPPAGVLVVAVSLLLHVIGLREIVKGLRLSKPFIAMSLILLLLPLVNLITLWWLNSRATAALQRGGYVVGFFGAKKKYE